MLTVKKQNEKDKKQMKAKGGGEEEEKGAPCESGPGADLRPAFIHSSPTRRGRKGNRDAGNEDISYKTDLLVLLITYLL